MKTLSNTIPAAESGLAVDITYEITGETVRVNTSYSSRPFLCGYRSEEEIRNFVITKMTRPDNFEPTVGYDYGVINSIADYALTQSDTDPVEEPQWWLDHLLSNELETLADVLEMGSDDVAELFKSKVWVRALRNRIMMFKVSKAKKLLQLLGYEVA